MYVFRGVLSEIQTTVESWLVVFITSTLIQGFKSRYKPMFLSSSIGQEFGGKTAFPCNLDKKFSVLSTGCFEYCSLEGIIRISYVHCIHNVFEMH